MKLKNKHSILLKNFTIIASLLTVLFLFFSVLTYHQARSILENEVMNSNLSQLENTTQIIDNHIRDMRYISALLETNLITQAFFSMKNPETLYPDYIDRIQEHLNAYTDSHSSIDSIYLYSSCSDTILTSNLYKKTEDFSDKNWFSMLQNQTENFEIFFRAKEDSFPFVMTLIKQLKSNGHDAAIVININLSMLPHLKQVRVNPYQEMYIISDNGEILFRNGQRNLPEPLDTVEKLAHYQMNVDSYSFLQDDESYTFNQVHSSKYPWSYVLVTYMSEYTNRLATSRAFSYTLFWVLLFIALLLALLFSLHSVKPIKDLLRFLQDPQDILSVQNYTQSELSAAINHFVKYIQQNQALTAELTDKLNQLHDTKLVALQSQINPHFLFNTLNMIHISECEALGYHHTIPRLTLNLSKMMHYAIESTDLVRLDTELEYTDIYLSILQKRYSEKLHIVKNIDNAVLPAKIPKLFIQPIIENAVFHGLAKYMKPNSTLTITCALYTSSCLVRIQDNGIGMDADTLNYLKKELNDNPPLRGSIGLKNVVARMKLYYGDEFSIDINSVPGEGSSFSLFFPFWKD